MPYCSIKCPHFACGLEFVVYEYSASFRAHGNTGAVTCPFCQQNIAGDAAKIYITDTRALPASLKDKDQAAGEVFP